jgi:hypothetical protein
MKINRNQKSVLSLFIVVFGGLLLSGASLASVEGIVVWIILGCWFYGVRDKAKPT